MYLTRMELDIGKRNTMRALVSPNIFHGAIEAAFPGEKDRKLWRIDNISQRCYLLILSPQEPMLEHAVKQFGLSGNVNQWETKDYKKLLDKVENDTIWRFRLVANPTKSVIDEKGNRGSVHAHNTPFYQKKWLIERCEKNGFMVTEEQFSVMESKWYEFYKGSDKRKRVTLLSVTYEGILSVMDSEKFKRTLIEGIGRGKAYGMGMLTVAKVGDEKNE